VLVGAEGGDRFQTVTRRPWLTAGVVLGLALTGVGLWLWSEREPYVAGKWLSEWLEIGRNTWLGWRGHGTGSPELAEASSAVEVIGTDALPTLRRVALCHPCPGRGTMSTHRGGVRRYAQSWPLGHMRISFLN
jgi:hypothetical protein